MSKSPQAAWTMQHIQNLNQIAGDKADVGQILGRGVLHFWDWHWSNFRVKLWSLKKHHIPSVTCENNTNHLSTQLIAPKCKKWAGGWLLANTRDPFLQYETLQFIIPEKILKEVTVLWWHSSEQISSESPLSGQTRIVATLKRMSTSVYWPLVIFNLMWHLFSLRPIKLYDDKVYTVKSEKIWCYNIYGNIN